MSTTMNPEFRGEERTRCERPVRMPGRITTSGMGDTIELRDEERTRCEVWTRVMGYHRPVSAWNPGKQAEHADRRYYAEPNTHDRDPQTNGGH